MPQVFQVLNCYKCSVFQIHQTKKSNKFECKICGEKQSIKRHYGIGTGKDCRMHVQKLNVLRGETEKTLSIQSNSDEENKTDEEIPRHIDNYRANPPKKSKWSEFTDNDEEIEPTEESMFLGDSEVFLEIPQKKSSKFNVKAKANILEENVFSIDDVTKVEIKSHLRLTNKNKIDNFESDKSLTIQDNTCKGTKHKVKSTYNNDDLDKKTVSEKSIVLPIRMEKLNQKSKWAHYVDTEEDNKGSLMPYPVLKEFISNSDNLFSLCNNSDLDNVLDI